ncbi:cell wall-binding repeat-containing protein [Clostridioides mangenotii]|uniref:cell wall-binding repeat-containing protein n=1 Tax=Metaclostridioides mangenotii TaxID=1540 RepID=UPI00214A282D|nr:cell wall-binding repeat-containing protein [Clostridioides mangenotii]MCR1953567.1 cell wall-binding repeat-containing protein [Clostridioides mangenotii]
MSKKRNLAVLMAAATVATSVAPVFAAQVENLDEASLIAKVKELLGTKYSDPNESGEATPAEEAWENSVYKIVAGSTPIKSVSDLEAEIEKAKVAGNDLTVEVTDKGHKEVDGRIVHRVFTDKIFYKAGTVANGIGEAYTAANSNNAIKNVKAFDVEGKTTSDAAKVDSMDLELYNGTKIALKIGSDKLDLNEAIDANGNKVVVDANSDDSIKNSVVGFKVVENDKKDYVDVPSSIYAKYTLGNKTLLEKNASDYYTYEGGFTEKGAELFNKLNKHDSDNTIVYNGVKYNVEYNKSSEIKATDNGYELTIDLKYKKDTATNMPTSDNLKLVLKAKNQEDLTKIQNAINNDDTTTNEVVEGKVTYLAGDDRFDTAVEISKEAFNDKAADAVVLVGENAIVDGLASAPLAKQENAPILLTQKDQIPSKTLSEMKRVIDKGQDVYLIGGESTISDKVKQQLVSELNANIIRVSGEDRFSTSTAIADKLNADKTKAYVVGGNGLADAMSIASVAARDNAPILVTPADGLGADAKATLREYKAAKSTLKVDVIGGTTNVSTKVLKDLQDDEKINVNATRIAGETRADTNAKVLETFYAKTEDKKDERVTTAYVAKDGYVGGDGQLIDALAAAPSAGKDKAPMVLTSDKLTDEQEKQVKASIKPNDGVAAINAKLYQVGQGVGSNALRKLIDLFNLQD